MGSKPAEKEKAKKAAAGAEKKEGSVEVSGRAKKKVRRKKAAESQKTLSRSEKKCKIAKCKRSYKAKGYCKAHYKKWRHGAYGRARYKICGELDCRKPMVINLQGYCADHYKSTMSGTGVKAAKKEEAPAAEAANA